MAFALHCLVCALAPFSEGGAPAASPPGPAAQAAADPEPSPSAAQPGEIVVTGRRGAAEMPPESELDAAEIDALGAYDIGEAIRRTAEAYALGDAPVVIVNGRRVADPGVFFRFPPDALVRVEVLPREAGAVYGDDPSRRVLNIVLQREFRSRDGMLDAESPTAGGTTSLAGDLRQGGISGNNTTQFGMNLTRDSALLAGERAEYSRDHPGHEPVTLRPAAGSVSGNLALTRALGDWSASLNLQAQARESRSVVLRSDVPTESRQTSHGISAVGGVNGDLSGWSLRGTLTGGLSGSSQSGLTDTQSRQQALTTALSASGKVLELPAGPAIVNLSSRASRSRTTSDAGGARRVFSAHTFDVNGDLLLPLLQKPSSGQGSALAGVLGNMSMTLGANLRESDAGRGKGLNLGLAWIPLAKLRLTGAWSTSTDGVSDEQRFAPEYYGQPITVYDFATGKSAEVLPVLGGTPDLRPPRFDRMSLSVAAGPFTDWRLSGSVSLQQSAMVDRIGPLPAVTPEVEVAFPERFRRNAEGELIVIDQRPINFDSTSTKMLTSSLSAAFPLGPADAGQRRGTLRVAFSHTWQLRNVTIIHDGLPKMDLLSGDGGSQPLHQFNVQLDGRRGPWGVNATARWRTGYRIRRDSGRDGPADLVLAPIGTADLKLSYRFERAVPVDGDGESQRRGVGLQLALEVDNLFDVRPAARLGEGSPAPGYGRDDQDPIGRTVRVTLRGRL